MLVIETENDLVEDEVHCGEWSHQGPFGIDAAKGATVPSQRTVLAVVHSVVTGTRLADVLPVVAEDWRVQVVFTPGPSLFTNDVQGFLHDLGAHVVPWQRAISEQFDLAIAADTGGLERIHAPVILMPHGVGYGKLTAHWPGPGIPSSRHHARGTERQQLIYHGRVVPSAILLAHHDRLGQLRRSCPEAVPAAVIAGDPCHDRLSASLPFRDSYRRALKVPSGQKLILVTSTWGSGSLLGQGPGILDRLMTELPSDRYKVAVARHPDCWDWHSAFQLRSWTKNCLRRGMTLLPSPEGWRAALVASDLVVGDHGSVSTYSAAAGVPVVLGAFPDDVVAPGSAVELLGRTAPRLNLARPLRPQLDQSIADYREESYEKIRDQVTSVPGEARRIIRQVIYRHLDLDEPPDAPRTDPVPRPGSPQDQGSHAC